MSRRYRTGAFHDRYGWGEEQAGPWKASLVLDFMAANQVDPRRACEIGCGTGAVIRRLAEAMPGTSFTGFDVAPVVGANEERPNLRFELRDIVTEPPTEVFDLALLLDVIEHVENPWELLRSVRRTASMAIFHIPLGVYGLHCRVDFAQPRAVIWVRVAVDARRVRASVRAPNRVMETTR